MSYIREVERAITAIGPDPAGYSSADLASAIGVTRQEMTSMLAQFRWHQRDAGVNPKFFIACEGYGPGARWMVLHAEDKAFITAKNTAHHAKYIVWDAVARYITDYVRELEPALLKRTRKADKLVVTAANQAVKQLEAVAEGLAASLGIAAGVPGEAAKTPVNATP